MVKKVLFILISIVISNLCLLSGFAEDSTVRASILENHTNGVTSVAFSPDGNTLAREVGIKLSAYGMLIPGPSKPPWRGIQITSIV